MTKALTNPKTATGHTEAEGHAASLRQMADHNYVDFDELRAAADFIERSALSSTGGK